MKYADKVLKSNVIFTSCGDKPVSGGIAIAGNRIISVEEGQNIDKYIGSDTEVIEYEDKMIMPGLIDGHDHLWWGAVANSDHMVDLTASTSEEEAIEMIKEYAASHPDEKRIRGFGWFPANWNDAPLPTKISLDEAVPDRPAYMNCADAHTGWYNSLAMEESGYYPGMDLGTGHLGTFENGELNGLVFEPDAMASGWANIYDFPPEQIEKIASNFMADLAREGVTSFGEMSADDYEENIYNRYKVLSEMDKRGEITCRIHLYTRFMGLTDFSITEEWQKEFFSDKFRLTGLKGFLDGVTSTYTGLLLEPYADKPETCGEGVPLATQEDLNASVIAGNAAGFPVRIHAIGDAAVRMALDAFEESLKVNGEHGLVNAIEHIETLDPKDLPRFKELGVIASMQAEHLPQEFNEKVTRLGEERCRYEWAFRSLLDAGATLAFGTDYPVVHFSQLKGIYYSIARKNYDGTPAGVDNGEHLTLPEALRANTIGSATVYGREKELGTLEAGKLADIIVLDRNLFAVPVEEIKDTEVLLTMMDGDIIYRA